MKDNPKSTEKASDTADLIFYEGKLRSLSEAGSLLVKNMIEDDLPKTPDYPTGQDPYKWLAQYYNKTVRGVTNWSYDWEGASGAKPTILDFFQLARITKSKRVINFIYNLVSDETPYAQADKYKELLKTIAKEMKDFANTVESLAGKIQK